MNNSKSSFTSIMKILKSLGFLLKSKIYKKNQNLYFCLLLSVVERTSVREHDGMAQSVPSEIGRLTPGHPRLHNRLERVVWGHKVVVVA